MAPPTLGASMGAALTRANDSARAHYVVASQPANEIMCALRWGDVCITDFLKRLRSAVSSTLQFVFGAIAGDYEDNGFGY